MGAWDLWRVERAVRRAGHQLAESLWDYWPTEGTNELSERNVTTQLAASFGGYGFKAFTETHSKGRVDQRFDLFLLNHDEQVAIAAEAKRLYSAEKASEMTVDLDRVLSFVARDEDVADYRRFGLIAATIWNRRIAAWWSSAQAEAPTPSGAWSQLAKHKAVKDAHWGSVVLQGLTPEYSESHDFHYYLYCVFELP